MGLQSSSSPSSSSASAASLSPRVQVYVRARPLIEEENGHDLIEYKLVVNANEKESASELETSITTESASASASPLSHTFSSLKLKMPSKERKLNPAFQTTARSLPARLRLSGRREEWKVFEGFQSIFGPDATNEQVYETTMKPLLSNIITKATGSESDRENESGSKAKQSICVFTYGHTGSGKSHTLLGYDNKNDARGIYDYAVRDIFVRLDAMNQEMDYSEAQRRILLVRITELYKDTVKDLIMGDDTCSIRQGKDGVVCVRGPMITSVEDGKVNQRPLGMLCRTPDEVVGLINKACESRRVGVSTHHDQSSRSHLVMEFEVVTAELNDQRHLHMHEEAELTRLKWLQTERMFGKHEGQALPVWTNKYTDNSADRSLINDINKYEKIVNDAQKKLNTLENGINIGATLVVCDLAGNEYARDAASSGSTSAEFEEAAQINKSLLAVKEMIRGLNDPRTKHVPYRDSKLSMMLKRHLEGGDDSSSRAVMIGHISPSTQFIRKTVNTLSYTSMMGGSGNKSGGNKSKTGSLANKKN